MDKPAHSLQGEAHACPTPSDGSLWAEGLLKLLGEVLTEAAYKKLKRAPSQPSTRPSISYSPAPSLLSVPVHYCCPDEYGDKLTSEWVPGSRNNKQGPLSSLSGRIEGAGLGLPGGAPLLKPQASQGQRLQLHLATPESPFRALSWGHFHIYRFTKSPSDWDE